MAEGMTRCFVAAEIPEKQTMENIMRLQEAVEESGADAKLVEPTNIHITLMFLGEISREDVGKVQHVMEKLEFKAFEVELKGVGAFPNLSRINVVWIGIQKGTTELTRIFSELEPEVRGIGIRLDSRGFSPHLTIARIRTGRNKEKLASMVSEARNREFGTITVDSIKLKKSVLTPKGPIYSTIYEARATI